MGSARKQEGAGRPADPARRRTLKNEMEEQVQAVPWVADDRNPGRPDPLDCHHRVHMLQREKRDDDLAQDWALGVRSAAAKGTGGGPGDYSKRNVLAREDRTSASLNNPRPNGYEGAPAYGRRNMLGREGDMGFIGIATPVAAC